jgi:hypothetical protein
MLISAGFEFDSVIYCNFCLFWVPFFFIDGDLCWSFAW